MNNITSDGLVASVDAKRMTWLYVTIIILCALAMMFFSADVALGAIGLKSIYLISGSIIAGVGVLLLVLTLKRAWSQGLGMWFLIAVVIFLLISVLTSGGVALVMVAWVAGILISILSYYLPLQHIVFWGNILFFALIVVCLWRNKLHIPALRTIARLMLFFAVLYLLGTAWQPGNAEFRFRGRLTQAEHVYWLYVQTGWLGDPDTLILYECNGLSLGCMPAYVAPSDYYQRENLRLKTDEETGSVVIYVNDTLLHRHDASQGS